MRYIPEWNQGNFIFQIEFQLYGGPKVAIMIHNQHKMTAQEGKAFNQWIVMHITSNGDSRGDGDISMLSSLGRVQ